MELILPVIDSEIKAKEIINKKAVICLYRNTAEETCLCSNIFMIGDINYLFSFTCM